ncbi:MAG: hypothetical protein IJ247_01195 [Bacilli bacterium]|nr:hypothetical protein [Bacilli bacterium]
MKNIRPLVILLSSAALLASCQGFNNGRSSTVVSDVSSSSKEGESSFSSEESSISIDSSNRFERKGSKELLSNSLESLSAALKNIAESDRLSFDISVVDELEISLNTTFKYSTPDSTELALQGNDIYKNGGIHLNLDDGSNLYVAESEGLRRDTSNQKVEAKASLSGSIFYESVTGASVPHDFVDADVTAYVTDGKAYIDLSDEETKGVLDYTASSLVNVFEDIEEEIGAFSGKKICRDVKNEAITNPTEHEGELKWYNPSTGKYEYEESLAGDFAKLSDSVLGIRDNVAAFSTYFDSWVDGETHYIHADFNTIKKFQTFMQRIEMKTSPDTENWKNINLGENPKLEAMITYDEEGVKALSVYSNLEIGIMEGNSIKEDDLILNILRTLFGAGDIAGYNITGFSTALKLAGGFDVIFGNNLPSIPSSFSEYVY